jgi:hypothetical protein
VVAVYGDVISQAEMWLLSGLSVRLQVLWPWVQISASPKLGLVVKSCNTAPGGQEHAIGLHGLTSSF